jgi:hypothetical protein
MRIGEYPPQLAAAADCLLLASRFQLRSNPFLTRQPSWWLH